MINLFGAVLIFWGTATYYTAPEGAVLYCDQHCTVPQVYSQNTAPWVAVDESWYLSGLIECGDEVTLLVGDEVMTFRALDAGRFRGRWVSTWPVLPIRIDLPEFYKPDERLSWLVIGIIVYDID